MQRNQWGFFALCSSQKRTPGTPEAVWAAVRLLASAEYPFPIFFMLQVLNITLTRWTSRCEQQKVLCFSTRQSYFADCFGFDLRHPGKIKFVVISDYVLLTSAKTLLTTKGTTSRVHEIGKIPPSCWCLIHRNLHYFCHSGKHTIKHHIIKIMLFFTYDLRNILRLITSPDSWRRSRKIKTKTKNRSTLPFKTDSCLSI